MDGTGNRIRTLDLRAVKKTSTKPSVKAVKARRSEEEKKSKKTERSKSRGAEKTYKQISDQNVEWLGESDTYSDDEKVSFEPQIGTPPPKPGTGYNRRDSSGDDIAEDLSDLDADNIEEDVVPEDSFAGAGGSMVSIVDNRSVGLTAQERTLDNIVNRYEELHEKWLILPDEEDTEYFGRLPRNYRNVDVRQLEDGKVIDEDYEENSHEIAELINFLDAYLFEQGITAENMSPASQPVMIRKDLNRMLLLNSQTRDVLHGMLRQKTTARSTPESFRATDMAPKNVDMQRNQFQTLVEYLYQRAAERGYRRLFNTLYAPKHTSTGYYTHSYYEVMKLSDFVASHCSRYLAPDNWFYITGTRKSTGAELRNLIETMEKLPDPQLRELKRDRHKFSFRNGVLVTRILEDELDEKRRPIFGRKRVRHQFYPYDSPTIREVDASRISAKYFDLNYNPYPNDMPWEDIPTPMLDHVVSYQFKHRDDYKDIYRSFFMDIGRMMFEPKDLEDWQYSVHFIGIPGTGKSTVTDHVVKNIYETVNVAVISNNLDQKFGLGGLLDEQERFVAISDDLDESCLISVTDVMNIISGDPMTLNVKYDKGGLNLDHWPTNWLCTENSFPTGWKNKLGMFRRVKLYNFMRRVAVKRGDLADKIALEMPNIMQKAVRAYHHFVNQYGRYGPRPCNWMDFRPAYFVETSEALSQNTNFLRAFVTDSGRCAISPELAITETDFFAEYKDYCRIRGARADVGTKQITYENLVQELSETYRSNITYEKRPQFEYEGRILHNQYYFFGIGLSSRLTQDELQDIFERNQRVLEELSSEEDSMSIG